MAMLLTLPPFCHIWRADGGHHKRNFGVQRSAAKTGAAKIASLAWNQRNQKSIQLKLGKILKVQRNDWEHFYRTFTRIYTIFQIDESQINLGTVFLEVFEPCKYC